MNALAPLAVAVPLLAAAAIAAVGEFVPVRVANWIAAAVAAAVTGFALVLLFDAWSGDVIYWFGGWHPRDGVAIGISFVIDPIGAGMAALAGFLALCALVASSAFFKEQEAGSLFYTLMLVFLAGMVGFSLTGDLFNMFVFFELMGVAAYALTGYKTSETAVLHGAINFAVTNTVGGFMILFGIALLYGRTAALNLSQIGEALTHQSVDGLVIASFVLIVVGLLIKAAAAPFHFWLADAYSVAPAPVCVLLAGVMSDLGYHAIARIYWDVYAGALGGSGATAVRVLLVTIGVVTAVVGATMCLLEAKLKRIIAFLTISHGGVFLAGIALLEPGALAGASAYVETDGLLKGAAFLAIGATIHHLRAADELRLHGHGRKRRFVPLALVFVLCAVGLSGLPPFGPFVSKALIEQSASLAGYGWLALPITFATLVSAAALLRATGRIFLGLGPSDDPLLRADDTDAAGEPDEGGGSRVGASVLVPAFVMIVIALGVAFVPHLQSRALSVAERVLDHKARAAEVLHGVEAPTPTPHAEPLPARTYVYGALSTLGAFALAALLLYRRSLPGAVRRAATPLRLLVLPLREVHRGAVGDYVAYIVFGAAVFSAVWGIALH